MDLSLKTIVSSTFEVIARPLCTVGYHKPNQSVPEEKRGLVKDTGAIVKGIQKGTSSCERCEEELKVYRSIIACWYVGFNPDSEWVVLDPEMEKQIDSLPLF